MHKLRKCVPTAVSLVRLILAPFVFMAARDGRWQDALLLFALSLLSDYLDGYLAIRLDARTRAGKQIDRLCDFSMTVGGVAGIVASKEFSPYAREIAIALFTILPISLTATLFAPKKNAICRICAAVSPIIFLLLMVAISTCYSVMGFGPEITKWLMITLAISSPLLIRHKWHRFLAWAGLL